MDFLNSKLVRISQEGMYDIYVVKSHITCFVLMEAERRIKVWTHDHAPYEINYETDDEAYNALKALIQWISA